MADLSWGGYRNGQIPLSAMTSVRNELFRSDAGAQMRLFEAAFKEQFGHEFQIGEGYRTLIRQKELSLAYQAYLRGGPWAAIAATPGTSKHGWGVAADLWSNIDKFGTAEHNWAVKNGPRFGWIWGSTPSEPWHFEFPHPVGSFASTDIIVIPSFSLSKELTLKLQQDLTRLGILVQPDGIYGKGTTAAVKVYQKRAGLVEDGLAGPATQKAIAGELAKLDSAALAAKAEAELAARLARETRITMDLFWDNEPKQSAHLGTSTGSTPLNRQEYDLFSRRLDAYRAGKEETFNLLEIQIMDNAIARTKQ